MSRVARGALLVAAAAGAAGGVGPTPLVAQDRSIAIHRFHADIVVDSSGMIDVTERITVQFTGSWNGLARVIPVEYRTPQRFNWSIGLELVSATSESGEPYRTERDRERHYVRFRIWIPGAQNATKQVVLRYRARNALRFFEDHDELYWNITGDEWDVPVGLASAVIELPARATGVRATAFNGPYGATAQDADVEIEDRTVRITMREPLGFREGLTAVVGWDKGAVVEPTSTDRAVGFVRTNWPIALPIPVFFVMLAVWRRRGRDPERLPITVRYEPLADLTPAEAGTLLDNSVDMRDVTATMVDLAVRGYLRFEEREEPRFFGIVKNREYVLHLAKPESSWGELGQHERNLVAGLFRGRGSSVALSDLENEFYRELPMIKSAVFRQLLAHGFYRGRPDHVQGRWIAFGILLGLVVGAGGAAIADRVALSPVAFIIAGVLVAAIMVGFGVVMPARTVKGARALEHVLGFEEFLSRVESKYMEKIADHPELFDKYLPYAMAFGVEGKWSRAFEGIYRQPPTWYVGPGHLHFSPSGLTTRLSSFSSAAGTALSSSPRSSSGSGFGGGGSSGGGGGGGGGGGF